MKLLNLTTPKSFVVSARCLSRHLQGVQISRLEELASSGSCETSSAPQVLLHLGKIVFSIQSFLGFSLSCET